MHRESMVDLETLDTSPNAHILSIGAVAMENPERTFYRVIGTKEQYRSVSNSTLDWWCEQNQAAQDEVLIETDITLKSALEDFIQFYKDCGSNKIWSHGAVFDVIILENAFKQYDLKCPWQFWRVRDTRTLIDAAERLKGRNFEPNRAGTYHNALHDAQHQTVWMNAIWEGLK